jgi:hypothetical protein
MGEVSEAMIVILVLEGCLLFIGASVYITWLIKRMLLQRANLFSVFLVIPTGFLRALASKQVVLDEDADSDEGSDAGDVGAPTRQEAEQQEAQKVRRLFELQRRMRPSHRRTCTFASAHTTRSSCILYSWLIFQASPRFVRGGGVSGLPRAC